MPTRSSVELKSRLPQITIALSQRARLAGKDLADAIAEEARSRVPVDSGALRDAIHVTFQGDNDWNVVAGDRKAFYGHIIEHGGVNTPARPFLVPAAETQLATAGERFRRRFRNL